MSAATGQIVPEKSPDIENLWTQLLMLIVSILPVTSFARFFRRIRYSTSSASAGLFPVSQGHMTLLLSGRTVQCQSPLTNSDEAFDLVRAAAARGDNVGEDEFPTLDYFRSELLNEADGSLALYDVTSGDDNPTISGMVIVSPCQYVRSRRPTVCKLTAVTSSGFQGNENWLRDLIDIGTSAAVKIGYGACVANVFLPSLWQLAAYRTSGFSYCACVPSAGLVHGIPGYMDSYILYKELKPLVRMKLTTTTSKLITLL